MRTKFWYLILGLIFAPLLHAQTLTGKVVDLKTKAPLMSVSVYFDNTTIGTTTNDSGEFSIEYSDAIQSNLVISYIGYDTVFISDYRSLSSINVSLKEALHTLDEVVIDANDGLTRKQKLRIFRKEFLGFSEFSKSCRILNEDDLILRYNKKDQTLTVNAKRPVLIKNKKLHYEIAYDIADFEIEFRYLDAKTDRYTTHSVLFTGTSFYKDLSPEKKPKLIKNRTKAYRGSIQHFMRSLYRKSLRDEGFDIFHEKFQVDEWTFFNVETMPDSPFKKVTLKSTVDILFDMKDQSVLQPLVANFYVDQYGNYLPITELLFSGIMGNQRIGDLLPSNYGLDDN
ncbi:carboxypeptidase-like regulatory domain-containing protein [Psychroserpens sp. SPM9]|uniref:carboxypeptidase-like regulatory domain-containing protein n=1 Tax=Psychroserpens sp. SPM9 TaxID=2975598 RepID=UPI0021A468E7|nr:carboxypeptidase-like regulatory domain-containing protein [Psychroserpens sp. SPM9]MDG5490854.1 carboxypeptidase-like regulatory domain-containing protein [Psychroserpens sp. SPM9]